MPKVLLVACGYPPGYQVGYERTIKFEKYLPEFGFDTCVLTVNSLGALPSDRSRRVYRAFEPGQLYRSIFKRLLYHPPAIVQSGTEAQKPTTLQGTFEGTRLAGLRNWCLDNLGIPDFYIGWMPAAILVGLKATKTERVDVIWSTSPPESTHLVAAILAELTRLPWVADFRDGWLFEPLKMVLRRDNLRRRLEHRLEQFVVSRANAVISVNELIVDYFRTHYPASRAKFHTITNGYDPADWQGILPATRDPAKFRLVHTGAFSISRGSQCIHPLLQGLQLLQPGVRKNLEVLLVGHLSAREQDAVAEFGLTDVIKLPGIVSRSESLAYQLSADCLLLISMDKSMTTSKLFEYVYSRHPILAITAQDNAAADIVRTTHAGEVVPPDAPQEIATCLARFYEHWQTGELRCQTTGAERYERRELARQLAQVLRVAINPGTA